MFNIALPQQEGMFPMALPDLSNAFAAQEEQAEQVQDQNADLASSLYGGVDLKSAKTMAGLNGLNPELPKLNFTTNANTLAEGAIQGAGNGINNAFAMRNYIEQRQRQQQIGDLYTQAAQRQQQTADLAQKRFQFGNQRIREIYGPELADMDLATGGSIQKKIGELQATQSVYQANQTKNTQADMQAKLGSITDVREMGIKTYGYDIFNPPKDKQTPAGLLNVMSGLGIKDSDIHDAVTQGVKRNEAVIKANKAGASQFEPAQAAENLQSAKLGNILSRIDINYKPEAWRLKLENMGLQGSKLATELDRSAKSFQVMQAFQQKVASGEKPTPQEMAGVQMALNFLGNQDPKIGATLREYMGKKDGKPITQKDVDSFFSAGPTNTLQPGQAPQAGQTITTPKGNAYTWTGSGWQPAGQGGTPAPAKPAPAKPKPTTPPKPAASKLPKDIGDKGRYASRMDLSRRMSNPVTDAVGGFFQGMKGHYDAQGDWIKE